MSEQEQKGDTEQPKTVTEEVKVQAKDLAKTIENVVQEGKARRVKVIRKGRVLVDIPLVAGVASGAVMAIYLPWIAAIAAVGALLGGCTVQIERDEPQAQ
jgi:hypothetical protein